MKTALAIGAGAIGLYVLYRFVQAQPAAVPMTRPPAGPGLFDGSAEEIGVRIAGIGLRRTGVALKEIFTGTSGADTFKTFGQQSDFEALKYLMCNCYKRGAGDHNSCRAVQQMAPGTRCRGGDCDCNPVMTGPGRFAYRDSRGSYTGVFGPKSLATEWTAS